MRLKAFTEATDSPYSLSGANEATLSISSFLQSFTYIGEDNPFLAINAATYSVLSE
jgi:hypothetical protein